MVDKEDYDLYKVIYNSYNRCLTVKDVLSDTTVDKVGLDYCIVMCDLKSFRQYPWYPHLLE